MTLPSTLELLRDLVRIPSVSSADPALDMSNLPVVERLADWMESLGWAVEVVPLPGTPAKANLIARLGAGDDGLVLAGHTDTVPWDEGLWHSDPFTLTERQGRLYGLGTADMKGFLALAIDALRDLSPRDLARPVTLVATADEETSMQGARSLSGRLGRYCVVGEPTGLVPVHRHKGILMERIRLLGRSGHSSDPQAGNSALDGMLDLGLALTTLRRELASQWRDPSFHVPYPTLNLGSVHGGDSPNRICAQCELTLDLRLLPGMDVAEPRGRLRDRARRIAETRGLEIAFEALFNGVPALDTPRSARLVQLIERLSARRARTVAFGTEGPFYHALGMETVICGPGSIEQAHRPDEYLASSQIPKAKKLIRGLIRALCCS